MSGIVCVYWDIDGCILIVRIRPSSNFTTLVEQWFEVHSLESLPPLREFLTREKKNKLFVRAEIKWQRRKHFVSVSRNEICIIRKCENRRKKIKWSWCEMPSIVGGKSHKRCHDIFPTRVATSSLRTFTKCLYWCNNFTLHFWPNSILFSQRKDLL